MLRLSKRDCAVKGRWGQIALRKILLIESRRCEAQSRYPERGHKRGLCKAALTNYHLTAGNRTRKGGKSHETLMVYSVDCKGVDCAK